MQVLFFFKKILYILCMDFNLNILQSLMGQKSNEDLLRGLIYRISNKQTDKGFMPNYKNLYSDIGFMPSDNRAVEFPNPNKDDILKILGIYGF